MSEADTAPSDIQQPLTLMAVRAHPDDECFQVGGTLARYSRLGFRTVLVICTGGENGEIVDPELDTPENKEHLADIRYKELQESCSILGVHHLEMLGYRDSGMADTPENEDPRSFNKADLGEATARLTRLIRTFKPDVLLTDNEDGSYGHPDHIMCNRISVAAYSAAADGSFQSEIGAPHQIAKLYYTAFERFLVLQTWRRMRELGLEMPWRNEEEGDAEPTWGLADEEIGAVLDVRPELHQKIESLRAHRSQIKPDMWILTLPPDVLDGFLGCETFQRIHSTVPIEGREDDLLTGLRSEEKQLAS